MEATRDDLLKVAEAARETLYDLRRHAARQGPGPDRRLKDLETAMAAAGLIPPETITPDRVRP